MNAEKRISLRLPADLHERMVARAATDRRSLNSEIVYLLETALGALGAGDDPPGGGSSSPAPLRGRPDSSAA